MSNFNNTNYQNMNSIPYAQQNQYTGFSPFVPPRLTTNVIIVTSLEEALIKTVDRNSDMIYFHQDKNEFYRVKVDQDGRKSWIILNYMSPNQDDNAPVTKAEFNNLITRIEALEALKTTNKRKAKEVNDNVELDG